MPGLQEEIALALCLGGGREVTHHWLASDLWRMRNRIELDPELPGVGEGGGLQFSSKPMPAFPDSEGQWHCQVLLTADSLRHIRLILSTILVKGYFYMHK